MPTFTFTCPEHGDVDHDSREAPVCFCGELMRQVFTVPNFARATDRTLDRDMAAYKRMRADGVQPKGIDGSARLEARANTKTELAMGTPMPLAKVREGAARSADVLGHDVEV